MKTKTEIVNLGAGILSLFVLLNFVLFGCATVGKVVPQERRIPLTDTQQTGSTFKQGSLTIDYSYLLSGTNMTINGKAYYQGGADVLDIRVVFLDTQGTVIEQKLVYATPYRASRGHQIDRNFEKTLTVPAGTEGFSFTYSSEARSGHR